MPRALKSWLDYHGGRRVLKARALLKDLEGASRLAQVLAKLGIEARVYIQRGGYRIVQLNGRNLLKLAERYPEWRRAHARRLLELAEKPPHKCAL